MLSAHLYVYLVEKAERVILLMYTASHHETPTEEVNEKHACETQCLMTLRYHWMLA